MKHLNLIRRCVLLMLFFTCVLAVLLSAANLFAQCLTYVSGEISGETWTLANSPYCVEGNITVVGEVLIGGGLVIEPGVRVQFLGNYVFKIQGEVNAIGTEHEEIVFTKDESNGVGWQGILFDYGSSNSKLVHCKVNGSINSGIRVIETIPTIEDCTIEGNDGNLGGGMYIELTSNNKLVIKNCIIKNNYTNFKKAVGSYLGGGVYSNLVGDASLSLNNCTIIGNTSYSRSTCMWCSATGKGGGIYKAGGGHLALEKCFIENNLVDVRENNFGYASSYGGGVYIDGGELEVVNSVIKDNSVYASGCHVKAYGGGIHIKSGAINVTNCTIRNNSAIAYKMYISCDTEANGGGISREGGAMTAINSIIFFNIKNEDGTVTNSQIYGNPTVTFSNVHDCYAGEGNICSSPSFIDNYHIGSSSPCINAGNNQGIPGMGLPDTDIDGEPRIYNNIVDMGADEYTVCEDGDYDGACDTFDNCPGIPNGPTQGICTSGEIVVGNYVCNKIGQLCKNSSECGTNGFCSMAQEDTDGDGIGDACDSEMQCNGNFDCDGDVDGTDALRFKLNFGRKNCPNCPTTCLE